MTLACGAPSGPPWPHLEVGVIVRTATWQWLAGASAAWEFLTEHREACPGGPVGY